MNSFKFMGVNAGVSWQIIILCQNVKYFCKSAKELLVVVMHVIRFVVHRVPVIVLPIIGNYISLESVGLFNDTTALCLLLITEQLEWVLTCLLTSRLLLHMNVKCVLSNRKCSLQHSYKGTS